MKLARPRTLGIVAGFIVAILFGGYWFTRFGILRVRAALAEEQTRMFEECRQQALATHVAQTAAGYMEAAIEYYPSGTKQVRGSHLDRLVERSRRLAVDDILRHLVSITGTNHGPDPRAWIQLYRHEMPVQPATRANSL